MHRSPLKGRRHWASERPADPIGILCVFGRGLAGMEGAVRVDRLDEPCGRRGRLAEALATGPVPIGVRNGLAAGGSEIRTLGPISKSSRQSCTCSTSVALLSIARVQLGGHGATRRTRWDREFESPLLQRRDGMGQAARRWHHRRWQITDGVA
jgi:hypothetical protein